MPQALPLGSTIKSASSLSAMHMLMLPRHPSPLGPQVRTGALWPWFPVLCGCGLGSRVHVSSNGGEIWGHYPVVHTDAYISSTRAPIEPFNESPSGTAVHLAIYEEMNDSEAILSCEGRNARCARNQMTMEHEAASS
ncbi:hypothetical protein FB451DRAFT_1191467 [Mycena latifolia]|nr:hypothetical protein FB451DRAFT_1191467 [Mycena latifolia]